MKIFNFDKNTEPTLTVFYISSVIMKLLSDNEIIPYIDLRDSIINESSIKADFIIPYALSFLFTISKIEYLSEIDSFRMVKS